MSHLPDLSALPTHPPTGGRCRYPHRRAPTDGRPSLRHRPSGVSHGDRHGETSLRRLSQTPYRPAGSAPSPSLWSLPWRSPWSTVAAAPPRSPSPTATFAGKCRHSQGPLSCPVRVGALPSSVLSLASALVVVARQQRLPLGRDPLHRRSTGSAGRTAAVRTGRTPSARGCRPPARAPRLGPWPGSNDDAPASGRGVGSGGARSPTGWGYCRRRRVPNTPISARANRPALVGDGVAWQPHSLHCPMVGSLSSQSPPIVVS